jgi:lipopolysaccharide assembly outer membrane protein LptD (OstA)
VKVAAKKIHYDEKKDTLTAEGEAKLFFHDVVVRSDKLFVDYGADTANADGGVSFDDTRNHIAAASFVIDWKAKHLQAAGDVRYRDAGRKAEGGRNEQEPFNLSAKRLEYEWKNRKGTAAGGVKISAEERSATADTALFDRKEKTFRLIGDVKIHQDSGRWLEKRDVFGEKDEKTKKLAEKPTDITCAEAFFDDANGRAILTGGVRIVQPHVVVAADSVDADSKRKIFSASGGVVYSQDSGDWLFDEKFMDEDVEEDVEKRIRKPLTVTAKQLVSEYGEDKIFVDGGVKFTEGQNSAMADRIWHYGESKRTVFEGKVSFLDDRGRDFTAERVIYDRASKTVEAFNGIKGSSDLNELKKKK